MRKLTTTFVLAAILSLARADDVAGLRRDVTFDRYSKLSSTSELMRRILSPLTSARLQETLARSGQGVRDQTIDLTHERFAVYVPPTHPDNGYALLVFVPPWEGANVPRQWTAALDQHAMIFVTAAKSGNDESVIDRREPLALLAAYNIMQQFAVDASRVYVGGFSGGSRVALRLALAYPDLFRGALLEAGSDPIGDSQTPLPDADLFRRFREHSHLVYMTGRNDAQHLDQDARSMRSLREWCVTNIDSVPLPWTGHETADAASFGRALATLDGAAETKPSASAACSDRIQSDIAAQLRDAAALVASDPSAAKKKLADIDAHFGGLAAPRSVELWKEIESRR